MGKWTKSLPEPIGYEPWQSDRAASALCDISYAMAHADGERDWALDSVRQAAAEVRARRKSLGAESERERVTPSSIRHHLHGAGLCVLLYADKAAGIHARAIFLRYAEAHLREAARLLTEQIEGAE